MRRFVKFESFCVRVYGVDEYVMSCSHRKVKSETATGSVDSQKIRTNLSIEVATVEFDVAGGMLRVSGRNVEENQFVKVCVCLRVCVSVRESVCARVCVYFKTRQIAPDAVVCLFAHLFLVLLFPCSERTRWEHSTRLRWSCIENSR